MKFIDSYIQTFAFVFVFQSIRYTLFAGTAYLLVTATSKKWIESHSIQKKPFGPNVLLHEVKYSALTMLCYALIIGFLIHPNIFPTTRIYKEVSEFGLAWILLSFPLLVAVHDTYFYWMHRLIHHPKLYGTIHRVHHQSLNPSPWASQSFHPLEAVLEMSWIIPIAFILPLHIGVLAGFVIFSMAYNIYGHLSVEIYPASWQTHPILRWLNTSTHHNYHHQYFAGNCGLYLLFWDRWMGTETKRL